MDVYGRSCYGLPNCDNDNRSDIWNCQRPQSHRQQKEYNDLEALSEGLSNNEVEGILLDVFTTNYLSNKHPKYSDTLEQVRILEFPFLIGIYMVHLSEQGYINWLQLCISDIKPDELEIYPSVLKYIIGSTIQDTESTWWGTRLNLFGASQVAFQKTLYILLSILAALIAMGLLWELFSRQKRRTLKLREKAHKEDAQEENWKQETLMKSGDFRRMMDRISDVEKCLAKISELKAAYNRMDGYSNNKEKYKSTREKSGYENSGYN